jgi:hypothetical protein
MSAAAALKQQLDDKTALLAKKEAQLTSLSNDSGMLNVVSIKSRLDSMGNQTNCSSKDRDKGLKSWIASNGQIWCDTQSNAAYNGATTSINSWNQSKSNLSGEINNLKGEIKGLNDKLIEYAKTPTGQKDVEQKNQIDLVKAQGEAQATVTQAETQKIQVQKEAQKEATKSRIVYWVIGLVILSALAFIGYIIYKKKMAKK